jgi:hypothetical protein
VSGHGNGDDRPPPSVIGIVTAGAGIVGYIYGMGAASLYLQLWSAGLPKGEALDEFTSRRFILIGVVVAAIAAALTFVLAVVIRKLASGQGATSSSRIPNPRKAASAFHNQATWRKSLALGAAGTLIAWLVLNTLILQLSLRVASVRTAAGCLSGIYVNSDLEGVHLADGVSKNLLLVPASEVLALSIGTKQKVSGQPIRRCDRAEQAATDLRALSTRAVPGG